MIRIAVGSAHLAEVVCADCAEAEQVTLWPVAPLWPPTEKGISYALPRDWKTSFSYALPRGWKTSFECKGGCWVAVHRCPACSAPPEEGSK